MCFKSVVYWINFLVSKMNHSYCRPRYECKVTKPLFFGNFFAPEYENKYTTRVIIRYFVSRHVHQQSCSRQTRPIIITFYKSCLRPRQRILNRCKGKVSPPSYRSEVGSPPVYRGSQGRQRVVTPIAQGSLGLGRYPLEGWEGKGSLFQVRFFWPLVSSVTACASVGKFL